MGAIYLEGMSLNLNPMLTNLIIVLELSMPRVYTFQNSDDIKYLFQRVAFTLKWKKKTVHKMVRTIAHGI